MSPELQQMLPMLLFFVVFIVFFVVLPQRKKIKKEKSFDQALKKGDRVVTKSGLHGKILELSEGTCVIETGAGKLKFERSSLSIEMSAKVSEK